MTAAVFLDRDGTLNVERDHFIGNPDDLELLPGVGDALRLLRDAGFALLVVTNQSGIARGLLDERDYHSTTGRLEELLGSEGVRLEGVYHCPHHPDITGPCGCRKPEPGLLRRAAADHRLDLARSFLIGDATRDIAAGIAAGCESILVLTGKGEVSRAAVGSDHPEVGIVEDLLGAAKRIIG